MKLGELIATARSRADDIAAPYLWSDAEWTEYANDAENEACRRARLITDASTTEICEAAITSGNGVITLDKRVIFVRRVKLTSQSQPLRSIDYRDLDISYPDWEQQVGAPRAWVRNWETNKARLWPVPDSNGLAQLRVVRLPLAPMANLTADSPEINARFHASLVYWMLFRAYSKTDSQTIDSKKASENVALFEQDLIIQAVPWGRLFFRSGTSHESPQFPEVAPRPSSRQPARAPQGPRLHHQQDPEALQGPPGLKRRGRGAGARRCDRVLRRSIVKAEREPRRR